MSSAKDFEEAFKLFDKDGNGQVSLQEISDLIKTLGADPDSPHGKELVRAATASGKGFVDLDSFKNMWDQLKVNMDDEGTENEIAEAFKEYDLNGDGWITREEIMQVITNMGYVTDKEKEATECLKDMDLDGDGKVSFAEFMVKWKL